MVDGWPVAYLWVWFPRIVIGAWLMCQFLSCRTCKQNRIVGAPFCVDDCVVAMDQPRSTKDDIHENTSAVSEFGRAFFCSPSLPHLTKVEAACRLKTIQKDRLLCWTWCQWIFSRGWRRMTQWTSEFRSRQKRCCKYFPKSCTYFMLVIQSMCANALSSISVPVFKQPLCGLSVHISTFMSIYWYPPTLWYPFC